MSNKPSYWIHAATASGGLGAVDRINEVLFGLIMVLTFTCSISAATAGHEQLSTILWSALGCNVAWGFVDSFMYLFSVLLERGEMFANVRSIRNATTEATAGEALKEALPPFMWELLKNEHITYLNAEIRKLPEPPAKIFLTRHDLRQAVLIFLLVFLSTFPVTLPFLLFHQEVLVAMRLSNGIALVLLFFTGVYLGKQTGRRKLLTGLAFALIGFVLVSVTMALGG
ncbi:MAG TPA: VIT1/CCC1 transporter family protein [Acidobacteriota bacterium]|nr:VIT1/CCC1 transporter family protein [Acidobacteriota bacterium]